MPDIDITKLRELLSKATLGPLTVTHNSWETSTVYSPCGLVAEVPIDSEVDEDTQDRFEPMKEATAELFAAAVNALPGLLDECERLRELVAYVDEPAGFNAACAADTDSFVAFMDAIEQKRKAIVERARAALAAADQKGETV